MQIARKNELLQRKHWLFPVKPKWVGVIILFEFSSLREMCPYSELFWPAFSRIRTEYGEMPISVRVQSECGPE